METWITADTHFGHTAVIGYCNRPFASVDEMDESMVQAWNSVVGKKDLVWHLGDVTLCAVKRTEEILSALNGRICLVEGNHDKGIVRGKTAKRFERIEKLFTLKTEHGRAELCHYPLTVWNRSHYGVAHFHGHSHGSLRDKKPRRVDVGVDDWGYRPIPLVTAFERANQDEVTTVDHHQPKDRPDEVDG